MFAPARVQTTASIQGAETTSKHFEGQENWNSLKREGAHANVLAGIPILSGLVMKIAQLQIMGRPGPPRSATATVLWPDVWGVA